VRDGGRIDERRSKNAPFMQENEGYRHYSRKRNEQSHGKHDNKGEQDHHGPILGSPTDLDPHHGPTVVAIVWASL